MIRPNAAEQLIPAKTLGVLRMFPADAVRLAGSSVVAQDRHAPADVDVFCEEPAFAAVLHACLDAAAAGVKLHPVRMPTGVRVTDLHELMSWTPHCVTQDVFGGVYASALLSEEDAPARFNPASVAMFRNTGAVLNAGMKLQNRGYRIDLTDGMTKFAIASASACTLDVSMLIADQIRALVPDSVNSAVVRHGAIYAGGAIRDIIDGRVPKDLDVFCTTSNGWTDLCGELAVIGREVEIQVPEGKKLNIRKFQVGDTALDVIFYGFVQHPGHIVETFDFRFNMLWMAPDDRGIKGPIFGGVKAAFDDIRQRRMVVGDNMWFRAGKLRALRRWARFREQGYVADEFNTRKYSEYVKNFGA